MPLSLSEPQAALDFSLASLHEELLFVTVFNRVKLIVLDFEVPLNVRDRLQEHEGHRMREALLKDAKYHAVLDEFGVTTLVVFAQLAHYVKMLDEKLLPLHLGLAYEIRPEYDLGEVDGEHLELVLRLILGVLDEDLEDADVVLAVSELPLHVDYQALAHLDLGETRLELGHLRVLRGRGRQVPPSLDPEVVVQQNPVLQAAQEVRDGHLQLLELLIDDQGVQDELQKFGSGDLKRQDLCRVPEHLILATRLPVVGQVNQGADVFLCNHDGQTLGRGTGLRINVDELEVKEPLGRPLGERGHLEVLHVAHEVAGDLEQLPVDYGDLCLLLALGEDVQGYAECARVSVLLVAYVVLIQAQLLLLLLHELEDV